MNPVNERQIAQFARLLIILVSSLTLVSIAAVTSNSSLQLGRTDKAAADGSGTDGRPLRIMPLGDSITDGLQFPGGYRTRLWQLAQRGGQAIDFVGSQRNGQNANLPDPDHEGHPGWTIQQLDQYAAQWVHTYRPDVILLHIGTNNFWENGELPSLAPARLARLIDHITSAAPAAHLYVALLVPSGQNDARLQQLNRAIPPMVAEHAKRGEKVSVVDQHSALTNADLVDGIHPNQQGYEKMAECWWRAMYAEL